MRRSTLAHGRPRSFRGSPSPVTQVNGSDSITPKGELSAMQPVSGGRHHAPPTRGHRGGGRPAAGRRSGFRRSVQRQPLGTNRAVQGLRGQRPKPQRPTGLGLADPRPRGRAVTDRAVLNGLAQACAAQTVLRARPRAVGPALPVGRLEAWSTPTDFLRSVFEYAVVQDPHD